jgi:hypothetical protein
MASRTTFSGLHIGLPEIAEHHQDLESSLRLYFSAASPTFAVRFFGHSNTEVAEVLGERIDEAELTSTLAVLASLEAAFRIDYLQRCYQRGKDPVSRAFREIYKEKQQRASLDRDIFETWRNNASVPRSIFRELHDAFNFRHWLAHGRYWTPKSPRFDFNDVFTLAEIVLRNFPFYEVED